MSEEALSLAVAQLVAATKTAEPLLVAEICKTLCRLTALAPGAVPQSNRDCELLLMRHGLDKPPGFGAKAIYAQRT